MKKESLLEKAKKIERKNPMADNINAEHIELALAWARGEVSLSQIQKVLAMNVPSTIYSFLAFALRKHIQNKK